jgi:hypothetical protein
MVKACTFLALQENIWVTTINVMNCIKFALATATIIPWKLGLGKPTHITCSFKHVQNTILDSKFFTFISQKEMNNRQ